MRVMILTLSLFISLAVGCSTASKSSVQSVTNQGGPSKTPDGAPSNVHTPPAIDREKAINIARQDFERVVGTFKGFESVSSEQGAAWRIIIQLKKKTLNGGGAIYLIDKSTGRIDKKEFYQ